MKEKKEEPKEYFERSVLWVISITVFGLFFIVLSFYLLTLVNPWGTLFLVPGSVFMLQALWLIVNPYAIIYEDRFEIKQSLLYNKLFYFLDTKGVGNSNSQKTSLIYNDGEIEKLYLFGMRSSHKKRFREKLSQKIDLSLKTRSF